MSNAAHMGLLWGNLSAVDHLRIIGSAGLAGRIKPTDSWFSINSELKRVLIAQWYLEIRAVVRLLKNWPPLMGGSFSMASELNINKK